MRRGPAYEPIGVAHIGTLLAEALGDADLIRQALGVWPAWEQAVGPRIARAARPVALRNGVLLVHVSHPVWMQELVAMRETLLRRIHKVAPPPVVRDLRFRLGPVPATSFQTSRPMPSSRVPTAPIPYEVAQAIRNVQSPALRNVLFRVAARWAGVMSDPRCWR